MDKSIADYLINNGTCSDMREVREYVDEVIIELREALTTFEDPYEILIRHGIEPDYLEAFADMLV